MIATRLANVALAVVITKVTKKRGPGLDKRSIEESEVK